MIFITILIGVISICAFHFVYWKRRKMPPGPIGIPVFGSMFSFESMFHTTCEKWEKQYGKIYTVQLGSLKCVIIHDLQILREAMNNPVFSGRPDNIAMTVLAGSKIGILGSDGKLWMEQRRFTLRHLRDFGFGKKYMENLIMVEVNELLQRVQTKENEPIDVSELFGVAVLNSLWMIVTGKRFSHDDQALKHFLHQNTRIFDFLLTNGIVIFLPWLIKYFPLLFGWNRINSYLKTLRHFFQSAVNEHVDNYCDDAARDFIDSYLKKIKETKDPDSSFYSEAGKKNLIAVMGDFFTGGSETTASTLNWAVLYLMTHQEVQEKLFQEIDEVIGNNRMPSLDDKANMPYTSAFMIEVHRKASVVSTTLFHYTTEDVTLAGYEIPKETIVFGSIYGVHHDPDIWGDPQTFRPERFLSDDGKKVIRNDAVIGFSLGNRTCLGQTLARDEFFLFIISIVQKFQILNDPKQKEVSLESDKTSLLTPKKYKAILKERFKH